MNSRSRMRPLNAEHPSYELGLQNAEISMELLARDEHALRRRILDARESAASVRAEILRTAERRRARSTRRKEVVTQLFAMPLIVDFGDVLSRSKHEVRLLGDDAVWEATIDRIWRTAFDGEALEVRPVPTMVHLNAVLGISPCVVQEQTFRGASIFEGRQPKIVPMCGGGDQYELGGGPRATVYLMLAYVASPASDKPLASGSLPRKPLTEEYLSAWFAVTAGRPSVRVLPPRRFYDALDDAHSAQLRHFIRWCDSKGYSQELSLLSFGSQASQVTIAGHYRRSPCAPWEEVSWSYDSSWRGPIELTALQGTNKLLGAGSNESSIH